MCVLTLREQKHAPAGKRASSVNILDYTHYTTSPLGKNRHQITHLGIPFSIKGECSRRLDAATGHAIYAVL